MERELFFDVLAERYASSPMVAVWAPRNKIRIQRKIWVWALQTFRDCGKEEIPQEAINAYHRNIDNIDLDRISLIEFEVKHDVVANVRAFNEVAGFDYAHRIFTSRDDTDPAEQFQIVEALEILRYKTVAILWRLGQLAKLYVTRDITGRSHLAPAQTTTMGKRFSNLAEELIRGFHRLEHCLGTYALRGIKGPMGTQQDLLDYLKSEALVDRFEGELASKLGFAHVLDSVGQVYPRSLDYEVLSGLLQLSSAPRNFAKMIRLMAGLDLAQEGFSKQQRGSSAMPHKSTNSRTCERVNGLGCVLGGYVEMISQLLGDQWFEGDVSCSVVRRIALPGACMALDGLYEAMLTVLSEMEIFEGAVDRELHTYLPFLSTTAILTALQEGGMGRDEAHSLVRKHSLETVQRRRAGEEVNFLHLLADDEDCPLDIGDLEALSHTPNHGRAPTHVRKVYDRIKVIVDRYPNAVGYEPEPIR